MITPVEDYIGRIGQDHAAQQAAMQPGAGGNPSGHCSHHSHADEERRRLADIQLRLDHIAEEEVDQHVELNQMGVLLAQLIESVRRLGQVLRRRR